MAIYMEKFASEGHLPTYNSDRPVFPRVSVVNLQCRRCGYEPPSITAPEKCPKCHGSSFERFPRPMSTLRNADRFPSESE